MIFNYCDVLYQKPGEVFIFGPNQLSFFFAISESQALRIYMMHLPYLAWAETQYLTRPVVPLFMHFTTKKFNDFYKYLLSPQALSVSNYQEITSEYTILSLISRFTKFFIKVMYKYSIPI